MSIIYISGGLLGDFIHQLSIVNELYINTNKKGIVYIANIGDTFKNGLEKTYSDLYDIVISQEYIEDFKIYNNEKYDLNLSLWRYYKTKDNIYNIFKIMYGVEWGKHKWLCNFPILSEWKNKTVINTVKYRFPDKSFFEPLKNVDLTNFVYVSIFKAEYDNFVTNTGMLIDYYSPKSLMELCVILNSCEKCIGSLSAPLSISTALHTSSVYGIDNSCPYIYFLKDINDVPSISYHI